MVQEPEKLIVSIDARGNVTIQVEGAKGDQCLGITQGLEQALGGAVAARDYTADYFEAPASERESDYA